MSQHIPTDILAGHLKLLASTLAGLSDNDPDDALPRMLEERFGDLDNLLTQASERLQSLHALVEPAERTRWIHSKAAQLSVKGMQPCGVILCDDQRRATVDLFGRVQWWGVSGSGEMVSAAQAEDTPEIENFAAACEALKDLDEGTVWVAEVGVFDLESDPRTPFESHQVAVAAERDEEPGALAIDWLRNNLAVTGHVSFEVLDTPQPYEEHIA